MPSPPPPTNIRQAAKKVHQESSILQSQAYPLERWNIKQEQREDKGDREGIPHIHPIP